MIEVEISGEVCEFTISQLLHELILLQKALEREEAMVAAVETVLDKIEKNKEAQ